MSGFPMVLYDFGQNADTADFAAACAAHVAPSSDSVRPRRRSRRLIHPVTPLPVGVETDVLLRLACIGHGRKISACLFSAQAVVLVRTLMVLPRPLPRIDLHLFETFLP